LRAQKTGGKSMHEDSNVWHSNITKIKPSVIKFKPNQLNQEQLPG